jgi:polygalacturonase
MHHPQLFSLSRALLLGFYFLALTCAGFAAKVKPAASAKAQPVAAAKDFNVCDYGAKGDGVTKDTAAIARAIDACSAAGGGRVVFPKAVFLTGPIHFKSNVELHLEKEDTTILFSTDPADYPVVFTRWEATECYNFSPLIYARDVQHIAITGTGTLDGQGRAWHAWAGRARPAIDRLREMGEVGTPVDQRRFGTVADGLRPQMIQFISCRDVRLDGVFVTGAPFWTIHPVYCEDFVVRDVTLVTRGPNTDGINPESCKNVLIERTFFSTGDDCISLKSGRDKDGRVVGKPCENITVRDCLMVNGHAAVSIGSEMSGSVRHVRVERCEARGTDRLIRFKSQRGRGGVVEDIVVENCRGRNLLKQAIEITLLFSPRLPPEPFSERTPVFRNFTFRDLDCDGTPQAVLVKGLEESLVSNLRFTRVNVRAQQGVQVNHGADIRFDNCRIEAARGPAFSSSHSRDLMANGQKF